MWLQYRIIMATKFEVEFPKHKGWYSLYELNYLSNSLGFNSSVFTKVIFAETKCLGSKGLSEKKFIEMLNLKMFDKYLDSTFNNKPADYNVRTIKKALQLIRHKVIGFPELSQARMTYFLYENDDQLGMDGDSETILKALKLCDRVMSPMQLDKYLIDMSLSVEIPCRLQLFEFLELMTFTLRIDSIPMTRVDDINKSTEKDDYLKVIQTKEQEILDFLDKQFRESQVVNKVGKDMQKMPITGLQQTSLVQSTGYNSVVSMAQDQATEIISSVEISTTHLRLARSGHSVLPSKADDTRSNTSLNFPRLASQVSQRQGLKFQFRKLPLREAWDHKNSCNSAVPCGDNTDHESTKRHHHKQPMHRHTPRHTKAATGDDLPTSSKLHSKPWSSVGSPSTSNTTNATRMYSAATNQWAMPLISKDDFNNHQHKIDDLKWNMLRKETTCAKLKHGTPSSVIIPKPHGRYNKDKHHKFSTLPIMDVHTLSLSVLRVMNESEENNEKPTTFSLSRSKSVNFKLN